MTSPCRRISILASSLSLLLLLRPSHSLREALYACPNPDAAAEGACPAPSNSGSSNRAAEMAEDEQTLLDLFGEVAKEILTKHVIPPTDSECNWDWRHARCEPYCSCKFRPLWGDFHLGRSCRLRADGAEGTNNTSVGDDDDDSKGGEMWKGQGTCHLPPDTPYVKAFQGVAKGTKLAAKKARTGVRVVAQKVHVRERVGKVKGRACTSWEERVNYDGKDMKQWQKKFCGLAGDPEEGGADAEERQSMRREFVSHVHERLQDDETEDSAADDDDRQSIHEQEFVGRVHQQLEEDERPSFEEPDEEVPPQFEGEDDVPQSGRDL